MLEPLGLTLKVRALQVNTRPALCTLGQRLLAAEHLGEDSLFVASWRQILLPLYFNLNKNTNSLDN